MKYDWKCNTVVCIGTATHGQSATSNTCLQARMTSIAVLHIVSTLHPCSALNSLQTKTRLYPLFMNLSAWDSK